MSGRAGVFDPRSVPPAKSRSTSGFNFGKVPPRFAAKTFVLQDFRTNRPGGML